jgi:predicted Zn-dependent protease with MMP-like domain
MPRRCRGSLARRFPQRRVTLPPQGHESFESLVERALDELPDEFRVLLADVAVVIEEVPTAEQVRFGGTPEDGWLYGLYEGVPGTVYGADMAPYPNKISLFRLPLETDFADPDELAEEVKRTVVHELAHHAGIDDDRLRDLDYD